MADNHNPLVDLAAGLPVRSYTTPAGELRTVEVPLDVWVTLNRTGRGSNRLAQWRNKRQRAERRARAEAMLRNGDKPLAVAHETGIPERTIQRWAAELRIRA